MNNSSINYGPSIENWVLFNSWILCLQRILMMWESTYDIKWKSRIG